MTHLFVIAPVVAFVYSAQTLHALALESSAHSQSVRNGLRKEFEKMGRSVGEPEGMYPLCARVWVRGPEGEIYTAQH